MKNKYKYCLIIKVKALRKKGKTYSEIQKILNYPIPKSTISNWCKNITLNNAYTKKINKLNLESLKIARENALKAKKAKKLKLLETLICDNKDISQNIFNKNVSKIVLAILCLGEASKSSSKNQPFYLGNSDPRIILLFLNLLKFSYKEFNKKKIRCAVQCRFDQDTNQLEKYWQKITKVPKKQFYPTKIDYRTKGKITQNKNYKGVLKVYYLNSKTQLDLETLSQLIYENSLKLGPVV